MAYVAFPFPDLISQNSKPGRRYPTLSSQFGDGYFQAAVDGLHPVIRTWTVVIENVPYATYAAVLAFLDARGKHTPFLLTMPTDSVQRQWRNTGDISETVMSGNIYSVQFTMEEDFSLSGA